MGPEALSESLSALANPASDHLDCELIHKGVTTRAIWNLAPSTPRWSVAHCSSAAAPLPLPPSPADSGLVEAFDITRPPDWSL